MVALILTSRKMPFFLFMEDVVSNNRKTCLKSLKIMNSILDSRDFFELIQEDLINKYPGILTFARVP